LIQTRKKQDEPINSETNDANLFRSYAVAYGAQRKVEQDKADKLLNKRNFSRKIDQKVYDLIDKCLETKAIPWTQVKQDQ
jgi:hypothetical protein